jgi:hypothetical protein
LFLFFYKHVYKKIENLILIFHHVTTQQITATRQTMTETTTNVNITDAEFNYNIYDSNNRIMLKNAYQAITMAEAWDWMKNFHGESFMFSKDAMIDKISKNMVALGYDGHSGGSYGWTMRCMEHLAKNGKEAFLDMCVSNGL